MYLECCRILNISPGSDVFTIKRAYRNKAKRFHPDVNPLPGAEIEFIKLKKAFDYLILHCQQDNSRNRTVPHHPPFTERHKQWQENVAKNRKPEINFKKTLFGKTIFYFFHLLFVFTGVVIASGPIITFVTKGFEPGRNIALSVIFGGFISLFGITMVVMMIFSGMDKRISLPFFR